MDHPTDFRFLQSEEFDGLSLDEKLAYVDVLCAEVLGASFHSARSPAETPALLPSSEDL